jgi:5'-phosphate synthase pdxT subunit
MKIGILALQGDFEEHQEMLTGIGVESRLVKYAEELENLSGLILPGGESSTMLKFLEGESLVEPVKEFFRRGGALYGTCAGAILLARSVSSPAQASLGLLDVSIERNGYGRQLQSHVSHVDCPILGEAPLETVFIRAPIIRELASDVEVLARHKDDPVFVRQGRIMATTFHPELATDDRVHRFFINQLVVPARA